MLKDFQQYVPSEVCLKCDGCCRFKEEQSSWRPKAVVGEKDQGGLAEEIFSKDSLDQDGHIKTVPCHSGGYQCSFFQPDGNSCGIYRQRPFECQLYPFILTKDNQETVMDVHLNCPYVQETRNTPPFNRYVLYLQGYFKKREVIDFIRNNPTLVGDYALYQHELERLFVINLES